MLRTNTSSAGLASTDLDTLASALYVMTDDLLHAHPERAPARPKGSFEPVTSDAEMLTLAVMQAVLSYPRRLGRGLHTG